MNASSNFIIKSIHPCKTLTKTHKLLPVLLWPQHGKGLDWLAASQVLWHGLPRAANSWPQMSVSFGFAGHAATPSASQTVLVEAKGVTTSTGDGTSAVSNQNFTTAMQFQVQKIKWEDKKQRVGMRLFPANPPNTHTMYKTHLTSQSPSFFDHARNWSIGHAILQGHMSTSMPDCGSKIARDQASVHLPDCTLAGVSMMRSEEGRLPVVLISSPQMPRRSASTASICSSASGLKIFSATTVMFLPSSSAATFPTTRCTLWSARLKLCTCSSWQKASNRKHCSFLCCHCKDLVVLHHEHFRVASSRLLDGWLLILGADENADVPMENGCNLAISHRSLKRANLRVGKQLDTPSRQLSGSPSARSCAPVAGAAQNNSCTRQAVQPRQKQYHTTEHWKSNFYLSLCGSNISGWRTDAVQTNTDSDTHTHT